MNTDVYTVGFEDQIWSESGLCTCRRMTFDVFSRINPLGAYITFETSHMGTYRLEIDLLRGVLSGNSIEIASIERMIWEDFNQGCPIKCIKFTLHLDVRNATSLDALGIWRAFLDELKTRGIHTFHEEIVTELKHSLSTPWAMENLARRRNTELSLRDTKLVNGHLSPLTEAERRLLDEGAAMAIQTSENAITDGGRGEQ